MYRRTQWSYYQMNDATNNRMQSMHRTTLFSVASEMFIPQQEKLSDMKGSHLLKVTKYVLAIE